MSRSAKQRTLRTYRLSLSFALGLIVILLHSLLSPAYGAQLGHRALTIADNNVGQTTNYALSFSLSTSGTLGSIEVQFCMNDPFVEDPCDAPPGMNVADATLVSQSGESGFSIASGATADSFVLTRTAAHATAGTLVSYQFGNVTNPTASGSYYARVQTFASNNASGISSDYGGIAFAITNSLSISAEVPPYLLFCTGISIPQANCASASGDYINFGEFSPYVASQASSQMLAASNAKSGYAISMSGTTLTSGNNVIAAMSSDDVSRPGTAQFGLNLRANTSPQGGIDPTGPGSGMPTTNYDQPNFYRFDSNDVLVSTTQPDNSRTYTVSYIANVPTNQAPGVYATTITYVCTGTF